MKAQSINGVAKRHQVATRREAPRTRSHALGTNIGLIIPLAGAKAFWVYGS